MAQAIFHIFKYLQVISTIAMRLVPSVYILSILVSVISTQLSAQPGEYHLFSGKYTLKYANDTLTSAIFHSKEGRRKIKYSFVYRVHDVEVRYKIKQSGRSVLIVESYWISGNRVLECLNTYGSLDCYILFYESEEYPKACIKNSEGYFNLSFDSMNQYNDAIVTILNRELDRQKRERPSMEKFSKDDYFQLNFVLNANKKNVQLNQLVEKYLNPE